MKEFGKGKYEFNLKWVGNCTDFFFYDEFFATIKREYSTNSLFLLEKTSIKFLTKPFFLD
jgi:hypothetical protein